MKEKVSDACMIDSDAEIVMALCMMKHLCNKGEISEIVYKNIKKDYVNRIKKLAFREKT